MGSTNASIFVSLGDCAVRSKTRLSLVEKEVKLFFFFINSITDLNRGANVFPVFKLASVAGVGKTFFLLHLMMHS